ncbi:two-component regulator propeller domain-containing protein, partial [Desulfobacterales bacterium HSG16]|nr:two-component regulator propeller domain-containing protein [Desulfobacterales bacterium HSG16]
SGKYFIATDKGISLWIGPGQYKNYTVYDGLVSNRVYDIAEDDRGRLWIGTEGGISIFENDSFLNFPCGPQFIMSAVIRFSYEKGKMTAHTVSGGNLVFEKDIITHVIPQKNKDLKQEKSDGKQNGKQNGRQNRNREKPVPVKISLRKIDFEKFEWKKVLGQGVKTLYPENYRRFQARKGLLRAAGGYSFKKGKRSEKILAMEPTAQANGSFWFITEKGALKRFDSLTGGLTDSDRIISKDFALNGLARASNGLLWIMGENRLFRVNDQDVEKTKVKEIPFESVGKVHAMVEDNKSLWFLADNGILGYRGNTLTAYTMEDGLPPGPVLAIGRDEENDLWAGGPGGFGKINTGENRASFIELENALRRAEQLAKQKGFASAEKAYEKTAEKIEKSGTRNPEKLKLLARARYHIASKDIPPIGWQLVSPELVEPSISRSIAAGSEFLNNLWIEKNNGYTDPNTSRYFLDSLRTKERTLFSGVVQPLKNALKSESDDNKILLLEYGNSLLLNREKKEVEEALEVFTTAGFSQDTAFLNSAACALAMLKKFKKAHETFEYILKKDPGHIPALFNLMQLTNSRKGSSDELEQLAVKYLQLDKRPGIWRDAARRLSDTARGKRDRIKIIVSVVFLFLVCFIGYLVFRQAAASRRKKRETGKDLPFATIKNPYIVGNPIRTSRMFYGREDDFLFVRRKLKGEEQSLVIVFCGERRSGKTSILFQILNGRLQEGFIPILLDMQAIPLVGNESDFLKKIAQEAVSVLEHPEWLDEYQWTGDKINSFQSFEAVIKRAAALRPGEFLIFLFDEYELIEEKAKQGHLTKDIIVFFANLLERNSVSFIFTGSRKIEDRSRDFWNVLIGKSVYRNISFLSRRDTERLITEPVRDQIYFNKELVECIADYTAGSPFYTQVICQNMVDLLNMKRKNRPDLKDLEHIIEEILDNPLPQMIYFWDSLCDEHKLALSLLGTAQEKKRRRMNPKSLMRLVRREKLPVSINIEDLFANLEQLYHNDILIKDEKGGYCFRIDLFRRWIARDHSVWEVVHNLPGHSL